MNNSKGEQLTFGKCVWWSWKLWLIYLRLTILTCVCSDMHMCSDRVLCITKQLGGPIEPLEEFFPSVLIKDIQWVLRIQMCAQRFPGGLYFSMKFGIWWYVIFSFSPTFVLFCFYCRSCIIHSLGFWGRWCTNEISLLWTICFKVRCPPNYFCSKVVLLGID